ncbi:MAG: FtsX-like permease family protein [Acidobacteria bacterium]|nr:FtsX-like permease family protein [Acidobacteriota bacterium]
MRRLWHWGRDLFSRRSVERELDQEIQAHLEMEIESLMAQGLSASEARRRARAEFGAVDAIKEECREARDTNVLEGLWLDASHSARMIRRYPLFSGTAIGTLALTLAAVVTFLSLIHTFMVRPLPVPEPDALVSVEPTRNNGARTAPLSYPDYLHLREGSDSFEELAAIYPTAPLFVASETEGREVNGAVVSQNFFRMLRVEPALGRFFTPDEDQVPERDRVAVLGYDFWQVWFGGDDDVIGKSVTVNGTDLRVVGVMPSTFSGVEAETLNIFMPAMMLPVGYRSCDEPFAVDCTVFRMYGRITAAASPSSAEAELTTLLPDHWRDQESSGNTGVVVRVARGSYLSGVDQQFLQLSAWVVGALLLACCANLAGLLMSRGRARGHEMAVRVALGAGRARITRQLTIESMMLAVVGGTLGLLLSVGMTSLLNAVFYSMDSSGRPREYDFGLVPEVLLGATIATLAAGLLFGLAPALVTARRGAQAALGSTRGTIASERGQSLLIGGQVALAVALVAIAGLFAASAHELLSGRGFDPDGVALIRLRPRLVEYGPDRARPYLRGVFERLDAHPQVESWTMVGTGISLMGFRAEVEPVHDDAAARLTGYIEVGPRYFETLGIELLRGRDFAATDDVGSEFVAIVSASAATSLWPSDDPIGQGLRINGTEHRVVGLVDDLAMMDRTRGPMPYVYAPFWQNPDVVDARLQVRVSGDPSATIPELTAAIHEVDANVPIAETLPLTWRVAGMYRPQRMSAMAVAYAASLAVFLSAMGLYASLAANVARRRREFGVRQAVGASAGRVLGMVVRQGMLVISAGALVGVVLSLGATRALAHMLYLPSSVDGLFVAGATALVLACGLGSAWLPARRAARVDPSVSLRSD